MKTQAAVAVEIGKPLEIEELELAKPGEGEVLVRYDYSGLCHSDLHIMLGDMDAQLPMVMGHEGAGEVLEVGPGVSRVRPGDHVVCSFIPNCGTCRYCASGQQSICDMGALLLTGCLPGDRWPISGPRGQYSAMCTLGTFSQYGVIHQASTVKIDDDLPLDKACLVGCGVPTGYGSVVYAAGVQSGDTVVVFGIGGIGINAIQGARMAGAKHIVAIDPLENKREIAQQLGATHAFADPAEAQEVVIDLTRGQLADAAILTPGLLTPEITSAGVDIVGKDGVVVCVGLNNYGVTNVAVSGTMLSLFRKQIRGCLFGDANPTKDIPKLLGLYQSGDLKLDELITTRYSLEQVNQGYDDMQVGKNIRGIIEHVH